MDKIITYSHLEQIITRLYRAVDMNSPTTDYELISERLGIACYEANENRAFFFADKNYIFLDRSLTMHKKWEHYGHELGHVMLHWGNQTNLSKEVVRRQEIEAQRFAFYFCVPTHFLIRLNLEKDIAYATEQVACSFNVTNEFAHKRLLMHKKLLSQITKEVKVR